MEVLENATIVKNLSDPNSLGNVWSMAKGLIGTVEFTEYERKMAEEHPDTIFDITQDDSFDNWCMLWDSFEKQWKEDLEYLNLDDLDFWLVNESNDIAELSFKLSKVKCRVGELWDLDKASQLHTDLLNIADRLKEIILNLRRNAFMCMYDLEETESNAHYRAHWMVNKVCKWVRDIIKIQERVQKIIKGAESILNPQPDTSTELPTIFRQYDIFRDNPKVANVFIHLIEDGLMKIDGNHFRWLDDRTSLCYLCYSLNLHYDLSTNKNVPWVSFSNMFLCKVWGKWGEQTNNDLRDNWQQFLKKAQSDYDPNGDGGKILPPKGKQSIWEKIENAIIAD